MIIRSAKEGLRTGWDLLLLKPIRTLMMSAGIALGIATVVAVVSVGEGVKADILHTVSSLGARLIVIAAEGTGRSGMNPEGFSEDDARAIFDTGKFQFVVREYPRNQDVTSYSYGSTTTALVTGTQPDFPFVHDWSVEKGYFFAEADDLSAAPVAVIGKRVKESLFPYSGAVGEQIVIGGIALEVIGVLSVKGSSPGGIDLDNTIFLPYQTAVVRLGQPEGSRFVMAKLAPEESNHDLADLISSLFPEDSGRRKVRVQSLEDVAAAETVAQNGFTLLLATLAMITLVSGMCSISTFSISSISERTSEIGVRKAMGATDFDIAIQFFIETSLLSLVGGLAGVGLGLAVTATLSVLEIPALLDIRMLGISLCVLVFASTLSAVLPSLTAARKDPVVALTAL